MKEEAEAVVEKTKGILQDLVVVVSLVHTLTDSFGSAHDLYRKLKRKSDSKDKDEEDEPTFHILPHTPFSRSREGHRDRGKHIHWSAEVGREGGSIDEDLISSSSAQVQREYDRGYRRLGEPFARGDLVGQTQLQFQIIQLQQTLLNIHQDLLLSTYLAPSSSHSHLVRLIQTIRTTRTGSIQALNSQYERLLCATPPVKETPVPGACPLPSFDIPDKPPGRGKRKSGRKKRGRSQSSSSSSSSSSDEDKKQKCKPILPPAPPAPTPSNKLFCVYSRDLQKDSRIPLARAFEVCGNNTCPFCRSHVAVSPGKSWEIVADSSCRKDRRGMLLRSTLLLRNRFVVKSHRDNGGLACVMCARFRSFDTVLRDIPSLMEHLWREHTSEELLKDEDIFQV